MFVIQQCLEQILILVDGHKHDIYTNVGVVRDTSFVAVVVVVVAAAVVKLQGQSRYFYIYSFFCHKKSFIGYSTEWGLVYTSDFPKSRPNTDKF